MASLDAILEDITRARGGDREAFDRLERHYHGRLERLVSSRLGKRLRRRLEARDLVQEAFLRAFRSIGAFRGDTESAFWSWLATIARHAVQEAGRRLDAQKAGGGRDLSLETGIGDSTRGHAAVAAASGESTPTPSSIFRAEERFERLRAALERLPPDYREVIRLARLQGLPLREVGQRMGRSEKAASVLLLRAMLRLKEYFGHTESFRLPARSLEEEAFGAGERGAPAGDRRR